LWHVRAIVSREGRQLGDTGWDEFAGLGAVWPAIEHVAEQYGAKLHPSAHKRWGQFRASGLGNARLRQAETAGVALAAETASGETLSIHVRVRV